MPINVRCRSFAAALVGNHLSLEQKCQDSDMGAMYQTLLEAGRQPRVFIARLHMPVARNQVRGGSMHGKGSMGQQTGGRSSRRVATDSLCHPLAQWQGHSRAALVPMPSCCRSLLRVSTASRRGAQVWQGRAAEPLGASTHGLHRRKLAAKAQHYNILDQRDTQSPEYRSSTQ